MLVTPKPRALAACAHIAQLRVSERASEGRGRRRTIVWTIAARKEGSISARLDRRRLRRRRERRAGRTLAAHVDRTAADQLSHVRGVVGLEDGDLDALVLEEAVVLREEDRGVVRRRVPASAGPRVSIRPCRCGPVHPQLALAGEGARARGRRARRRGGGAHAPVEEERDRVGRHACCIWCGSVGSQVEIEEERAGGGKGAKSERRTSESQRALRNPANDDRGSPGPPFSS